MPDPPSAASYVRAIPALSRRFSDNDRRLFACHYAAPDRAATTKQLAALAGLKRHSVVNSRYGTLGRQVCEQLGVLPPPRADDSSRWWMMWSRGWQAPHGFVWQMLPAVAAALEHLGWVTPIASFAAPDEVAEGGAFVEGATARITVNAYERSSAARQRCLEVHGLACSVCGMRFADVYGEEAAGYIHVHHLRPIASVAAPHEVDPGRDMRPVCPNCHAVIHLGGRCRTLDEVRAMLDSRRDGRGS